MSTYQITIISVLSVFFIKSLLSLYYHNKILDAILNYKLTNLDNLLAYDMSKVDFDDTEDIARTIFRIWDWGYKRILPKDKLEIIKPYIKWRKEKK